MWRAVGGDPFASIAIVAEGETRSYLDTTAPVFDLLEYRVSDRRPRRGRAERPHGAHVHCHDNASVAGQHPRQQHSIGACHLDAGVLGVCRRVSRLPRHHEHRYAGTADSSPVVSASYHDTSTAEYTAYWYRVASVDTSGNSGLPSPPVYIRTDASGTVNPPHGGYTRGHGLLCSVPSEPHLGVGQTLQQLPGAESSPAPSALLRGTSIDAPLCLSCHDGTSASDVMSEYSDPDRTSRHDVAVFESTGTLVCASCHAVHSSRCYRHGERSDLVARKKSGNPFCYWCHGATAGSQPAR